MANLNGFDASSVEPAAGSFDAIPAGKYVAVMTASEMKPTKSGTGQYLEIEFEVQEGPYKSRKLWDRLNVVNPSDQAVQIAKAQLSSICRAVGVLTPKDSEQLHFKQLVIKVKCTEYQGEIRNEIGGYLPMSEATETVTAQDGDSPF